MSVQHLSSIEPVESHTLSSSLGTDIRNAVLCCTIALLYSCTASSGCIQAVHPQFSVFDPPQQQHVVGTAFQIAPTDFQDIVQLPENVTRVQQALSF